MEGSCYWFEKEGNLEVQRLLSAQERVTSGMGLPETPCVAGRMQYNSCVANESVERWLGCQKPISCDGGVAYSDEGESDNS